MLPLPECSRITVDIGIKVVHHQSIVGWCPQQFSSLAIVDIVSNSTLALSTAHIRPFPCRRLSVFVFECLCLFACYIMFYHVLYSKQYTHSHSYHTHKHTKKRRKQKDVFRFYLTSLNLSTIIPLIDIIMSTYVSKMRCIVAPNVIPLMTFSSWLSLFPLFSLVPLFNYSFTSIFTCPILPCTVMFAFPC